MRHVNRELDRILAHLRAVISGRGFTQMEIQSELGWGRSYISQLLTKQKSLRFDHILSILKVLDVAPEDFFGKLYQFGDANRLGNRAGAAAPSQSHDLGLNAASRRLRRRVDALVSLLKQKGLIDDAGLARAVEKAGRQS
ncbi:MAG: helix-turn-helix transcriptional regulator [bacterium]|nr:helix-turn-helix transcriptional regulator [bacterium]